jgi:hypothetical protein
MSNDTENQITDPEEFAAAEAVKAAERVSLQKLERVSALKSQIDDKHRRITTLQADLKKAAQRVAADDASAMEDGKRIAAQIQDKSAELSVLTEALESAAADHKEVQGQLAAAYQRVNFARAKAKMEELVGVSEIADELVSDLCKHLRRRHELADELAQVTGSSDLKRRFHGRFRVAMAMRRAGLNEFVDLPHVPGPSRLSLSEQDSAFVRAFVDSKGQIAAPSPAAADDVDPIDVLPQGCRLSHRGMGRWLAYGPDGAQIGGLHMSRGEAIAALRAVLMAA